MESKAFRLAVVNPSLDDSFLCLNFSTKKSIWAVSAGFRKPFLSFLFVSGLPILFWLDSAGDSIIGARDVEELDDIVESELRGDLRFLVALYASGQ